MLRNLVPVSEKMTTTAVTLPACYSLSQHHAIMETAAAAGRPQVALL